MTQKEWKTIFVDWLTQRGPVTVLLFIIVGMFWQGSWILLDRIHKGYVEHAEELRRANEVLVEQIHRDQQHLKELYRARNSNQP